MTILEQLHVFGVGDKVTAEETNDNNQTLEAWINDHTEVNNYIDGKITTLTNNLNNQISSINTQISNTNSKINTVQATVNTLNSLNFTTKDLSLGVGTTSLSSYLPNDGKAYLVLLRGVIKDKSSTECYESVTTDRLTLGVPYMSTDGDSGRSSVARSALFVPVGSGRKITITQTGTPENSSRTLRGYCRI